jgi:metallo-beta-lactamase family protein
VLIECGLYQERQLRGRNWEPFPVPPQTIRAVLLSHAHVDHCGLIPKLVRDGFRGKIYCTEATADLAPIMLLDTARLQEEDAEFKKKRHEREKRKGPYPEVPLYTVEDARASIPFFAPVRYRETVNLGGGISATFYDAGHVLGSATIKVAVRQNGEVRTITFSGDLGRWNRPIIRDPDIFRTTDYVIIESTYGDREHPDDENIEDSLAEIVNTTWKKRGNIIVPSFALERSQEILYYMNKLLLADRIPHIMVFLDSPMAVSITEVFKRHAELFDEEMRRLLKEKKSPFDFPGLKMVESVDESKAINHIKGTVMIIAGSGMVTGGRIKHHLVTNISRPASTVLFVGYQAVGTLGREIVDGARKVRILGKYYRVRARIARLEGLSAHADRNDLLRWLSSLTQPPRRVIIVHGEPESSRNFAELVQKKTGWQVAVPHYGEVMELD